MNCVGINNNEKIGDCWWTWRCQEDRKWRRWADRQTLKRFVGSVGFGFNFCGEWSSQFWTVMGEWRLAWFMGGIGFGFNFCVELSW
jgi:hypothetical protein